MIALILVTIFYNLISVISLKKKDSHLWTFSGIVIPLVITLKNENRQPITKLRHFLGQSKSNIGKFFKIINSFTLFSQPTI